MPPMIDRSAIIAFLQEWMGLGFGEVYASLEMYFWLLPTFQYRVCQRWGAARSERVYEGTGRGHPETAFDSSPP